MMLTKNNVGQSSPKLVYLKNHRSRLRPRPHEAETGETVTVSIYPVLKYLRKDEAKRNRVDL